jgi:hypothetical protein
MDWQFRALRACHVAQQAGSASGYNVAVARPVNR